MPLTSETRGVAVRSLALLSMICCLLFPHAVLRGADDLAGSETADGAEDMSALARDFFEWRRVQQPATGDDIPRVERPDGWVPDVSPTSLEAHRQRYRDYLGAIDGLDTRDWNVASRVDARLLRAAIQRVHW
jgi:SpoVK/Ycf46/Vps4 family AAA+-type ATPase